MKRKRVLGVYFNFKERALFFNDKEYYWTFNDDVVLEILRADRKKRLLIPWSSIDRVEVIYEDEQEEKAIQGHI